MGFYPKTKKNSLIFYINESKLKSKLNIPFHHMFKYYEKVLKEADFTAIKQICKIAKYYIIDTFSYQ